MKIINFTEQESIFCQALAMTSLLAELEKVDFLNSDYYKENIFFDDMNNDNFKKILNESGIGNPATLQMFLYILLVMPKETLSNLNDVTINLWTNEFNAEIQSFTLVVNTTYPNESNNDLTSIDYYRHIRNAVSHSKCVYKIENGLSYVTFKDENPRDTTQNCEIKMLTRDVGIMFGKLHKQLMIYLNDQMKNS